MHEMLLGTQQDGIVSGIVRFNVLAVPYYAALKGYSTGFQDVLLQ